MKTTLLRRGAARFRSINKSHEPYGRIRPFSNRIWPAEYGSGPYNVRPLESPFGALMGWRRQPQKTAVHPPLTVRRAAPLRPL